MITTKNSLLNFLKQANASLPLIALDATYNLNVPGYPTIVVGTIDLHPKFHLGIFFLFHLITSSSFLFYNKHGE